MSEPRSQPGAAEAPPHDPLAALREGSFRLFTASRFFSGSVRTLLQAAISWHVYELSGSAFHLGLVGLVQFVPALTLSLVGGAAADAYDRRTLVMSAQLGPLACAAGLAAATGQGAATLLVLYAGVLLVAVAGAFESPARMALLPALVRREVFPNAVTVHSTVSALAFATGPAVAGVGIAAGGVGAAYALAAVLIAVSIGLLARMRVRPHAVERRAVSLQAIREGLAFVRSQPVLLGCMSLDMFAVIFGSATALLPIFASDILDVGARGYGVLSASLEAGALVMSFVLIALPPVRAAGRALLLAVLAYGVATIVFGLSRSFPLSVAAYMIAGMADQVSVVMRNTALQLITPDGLRGRVSSVNLIFIGASNQLGAVEAGFVAAATSATFAVVSGGAAALVVLLFIAWKVPALRRYRIGTGPAPSPRSVP